MGTHAHSVAQQPLSGVAPDVASRATFPGNANPDRRHFTTLQVPELPWPLVYGFVRVVDEDGTEGWACASFEIGRPIMRADEGIDPTISRSPASCTGTSATTSIVTG
jgi:hypothetical protein